MLGFLRKSLLEMLQDFSKFTKNTYCSNPSWKCSRNLRKNSWKNPSKNLVEISTCIPRDTPKYILEETSRAILVRISRSMSDGILKKSLQGLLKKSLKGFLSGFLLWIHLKLFLLIVQNFRKNFFHELAQYFFPNIPALIPPVRGFLGFLQNLLEFLLAFFFFVWVLKGFLHNFLREFFLVFLLRFLQWFPLENSLELLKIFRLWFLKDPSRSFFAISHRMPTGIPHGIFKDFLKKFFLWFL